MLVSAQLSGVDMKHCMIAPRHWSYWSCGFDGVQIPGENVGCGFVRSGSVAWNDDYNVDYDDGTTQTANTASSIPTYLDTLIAKESAIVITLPNGNYTARVSGVGGVTGIGRVGIDKVVE